MINKANVKNLYPLTPLQEGILFHSLYEGGAAYFEQLCFRVRGCIDLPRLQSAWDELVRRHDVLRTVIVHKDVPRPLQIVLKQWRIDFSSIDLSNMGREEAEARVTAYLEQDRATPFNLAKDPLTRVAVLFLAGDEAELVWSHHHIILDGWSSGILQAELLEIYAALGLGASPALPQPAPFADYVTWISRRNQEESRRFWREYLDGFNRLTGVPRFPVHAVGTAGSRGVLAVHFDRQRSETLSAVAAGAGVTLNVLLQTVWGILLCRLNDCDDAVFAATVSGRPEELKGIEGMVGLFINAVPVRIRLAGSASLLGLLESVQRSTLAAANHHWCSLADIQAETPLRQALLDHILIFENFPFDERIAGDEHAAERGFTIERSEVREHTNYPLELSIIPGSGLDFKLGYATDVYGHEQMERLAWSLEHLLDSVCERPEAPLENLSILSKRERLQILTEFNRPMGTAAAGCVADILERQAGKEPEGTALIYGDLRLTYGELNKAANRVSNMLQQLCAVQPDQVVGILMDRTERMMAGLLGIIKSGAAYLPLDPIFPAARIAYMLEDSGCRVVLTERKHRDYLAGSSHDLTIIDLDQLPDAPDHNPPRTTTAENLLYLIYTSGSTGLPKGVMLEQRNIISFKNNMTRVYGMTEGDTILALTTITFDISVLELICSLMCGMTVVLASDAVAANPGRAAKMLGHNGINILQITPSRLKLMLEEDGLAPLGGLKALLVGGEPLPDHLFERLQGLSETILFNVYGPTEATIWSTTARLNGSHLSIGVPLVDEDVLIMAPDGALQPVGVWGEICIGGQGLARGYWQRPELTADRFVPHPVRQDERTYRTGDYGRFLHDGTIQCGGRMDNQVKVRGYRIETGEIEQTLLKVPGIREAVAHIVEIDGLNEIAAYLVPDGAMPSPSLIRSRLAESLPEYMLPSYYLTLEKVPMTPNGKTDRKALPLPTTGTTGGSRNETLAFIPPRTETELALATIWQRVLGVDQVGMGDNFFDLGGHSIKAIRIASAIAKEIGRDIPLALIFSKPLFADLAAELKGETAANAAPEPLPAMEFYETSPGQRRLWVLYRMAPASASYNMPVALKIEGDLDTDALEQSLKYLSKKHESLRTSFPERDSLPVQALGPVPERILSIIDVSGHHDNFEQALRDAANRAAEPFDLAVGPLFRAFCYRTAPGESLLLLVMHHIIGDGWSWRILLKDLAEQYHLSETGRSAQLSALPIQYKEWAHYQNRALESGGWDHLRSYWHGALSGGAMPLDIPTDFRRPAVRRDGGGSIRLNLPAELIIRLDEVGRGHGATLFMVLLAILKTLLSRLSGQEEVTVGIPVDGRPLQQLEEIAGFFVNTLALRSRVSNEEQFDRLLERVRQTAIDGYEHQLYPFDRLVTELGLSRDTGRSPLFDVMAVMQEEEEQRIPAFANMLVAPVALEVATSRFDLMFLFTRGTDGVLLELEYASDLFLPESAARLTRRFLTLATAVADNPSLPVSDLQLLPDEELAALAACSAGIPHPLPPDLTMSSLFRKQAELYEDRIAVIATDRTLTYGELDRLSDNCAASLLEEFGLQPEEPVGVMTGRTSALPVSMLAIMKGGGVYLPIDPEQPENRIRHIIADSGLRTILVDDETSLRLAIHADLARLVNVRDLSANASGSIASIAPSPSSAAYIIYTSGSTGLPKGVLVEHGGFVNMILDQIRTFGITSDDRCLLFSSYSFDGAMSEMFLALHSGAPLIIARREQTVDPDLFSLLLSESGATVATLSPAYLNALRATGVGLEPLRMIITAGEAAIVPDVLHYARAITVFNAYGPTEASVCAAIHRVDGSHHYSASIPIGKPMANSELLLLDSNLSMVPFGVNGEICIGGPGLARGYLNRPELTAAAFVPHPSKPGERLYRTGDLGRRLADGSIEFLGRNDDQVKVRGFRIECGEVERALLKIPGVNGAVVVARGVGASRELAAFLTTDGEAVPEGIKGSLAPYLPGYMIPSCIAVLERFPLNANGKVDRKSLTAMDITTTTASGGEPPATEMEEKLAVIWENILERSGICRHDSFFQIGGQSISAIRVAAAIRQELGIAMPLPSLFRHGSLTELAMECERMTAFGEGYEEEVHLHLAHGASHRIFAFPPINGYPVAYSLFASMVGDADVHGFSFIQTPDRLERYCDLIDQLQPDGELILFGYSSGGNLAFEVARKLEERGRTISGLILLDSWMRLPGAPVTTNIQEWLDDYSPDPQLFGNLGELMTASPYIREIAFGKLQSYLAYSESIITQGSIKGSIYLVRAAESTPLDGLSQDWYLCSTSGCSYHDGSGAHLDMLKHPWVNANASVVKDILKTVGSNYSATDTAADLPDQVIMS